MISDCKTAMTNQSKGATVFTYLYLRANERLHLELKGSGLIYVCIVTEVGGCVVSHETGQNQD